MSRAESLEQRMDIFLDMSLNNMFAEGFAVDEGSFRTRNRTRSWKVVRNRLTSWIHKWRRILWNWRGNCERGKHKPPAPIPPGGAVKPPLFEGRGLERGQSLAR